MPLVLCDEGHELVPEVRPVFRPHTEEGGWRETGACDRCLVLWEGGGGWWRCRHDSDEHECMFTSFLCGDCHEKRQAGADTWRDVRVTLSKPGQEHIESVVRVRDDAVNLWDCPNMTEVPSDLRELGGKVLSMRIRSGEFQGFLGEEHPEEQVRLEMLPTWLRELYNLKALGLEGMEHFPELVDAAESLPNLEILWLAGREGTTMLPRWAGSLSKLKQLRVHRCESLEELPAWMGSLTGLQTLDLRGCCGLKELPKWMGTMTGLQTLDLNFCMDLKELPEMVLLTGLQTLNLSCCQCLEELPEWMGLLTGLQKLNLTECVGVAELPAGLRLLTGLQELYMSYCTGLQELPEWMGLLTGLQTLDLSRCRGLRELPEGIGLLTGLQTLDLSGCTGLTELPEWMGFLTGLQTLDLSECTGLEEFPEWMGFLTGLQWLGFSLPRPLQCWLLAAGCDSSNVQTIVQFLADRRHQNQHGISPPGGRSGEGAGEDGADDNAMVVGAVRKGRKGTGAGAVAVTESAKELVCPLPT